MRRIFFITFVSSLFFVSLFQYARAAEFLLHSNNIDIKSGGLFEVKVLINTNDASINAVEGDVYFPTNLLDLVNIKESNSIVNFWIDKPTLVNDHIHFSGIIPGGFEGEANIFQIVFKSKVSGQGELFVQNQLALLNDGLGTLVDASSNALSFQVTDDANNDNSVVIVDISDQDKPEPFTPIITKIPDIAGDNYVIIFTTQDKGSGIDYYQIKEGYGPFYKVTSPYILKNQKLDKHIFVRAVDKSGNIREVTIAPVNPLPWYETNLFFVILTIIIVFFIFKIIFRKKYKK